MFEWLNRALIEMGWATDIARPFVATLGLLGTLLLGFGVYLLSKRVLVAGVARSSRKTRMAWDDLLVANDVPRRVAHIVPLVGVYAALPAALDGYPLAIDLLRAALLIVLVVLAVWLLDGVLDTLSAAYHTLDPRPEFSIGGPVQATKLIAFLMGAVLVVSILLGRSPFYLLTGVGALSAVLMLIFKDPITGFAAGIQLSGNRMLAPGDWIEMPRYDADGTVLEVGLTTVKVQNFDQTVTTIPTYALVSESFKNWRGMEESGGRRLKRAIALDMRTIQFCTPEMMARFEAMGLPDGWDEVPVPAVDGAAGLTAVEMRADTVAGLDRGPTNVAAFRAYAEAYLRRHAMIRQDMDLVIRQLDPTAVGLPIEIYAFCADPDWLRYEAIQAEIFEHLLAVLPEFELRVFQSPTGGK